jgi:hypothetical protein
LRPLPGANRAPAFDTNVPGDLRDLRESVQLIESPRFFIFDETGYLQFVSLAVDDGGFVLVVVGIEREWLGDRAFGKCRR